MSIPPAVIAANVAKLVDLDELEGRQGEIQERLEEIGFPDAPKPRKATSTIGAGSNKKRKGAASAVEAATAVQDVNDGSIVHFAPKSTDTHWDFLLKEMMWLGADFMAERKRQKSAGKKLATAVKQYHNNKEKRYIRELAEAESKRRRLAGKLSREVRSRFWTKIEKVISYKQKISLDKERQKAMNKQLVELVKQTEKYSESLTRNHTPVLTSDDDESELSDYNSASGSEGGPRSAILTIEQALQAGEANSRKSKRKITDYSRLKVEPGELYGESTADDSGSDASYAPSDDGSWDDDETTLQQAEIDELRERKQLSSPIPENQNPLFLADPNELYKLRQEGTMEVQEVIQRLQDEGNEMDEDTEEPRSDRRVQFAQDQPGAIVPKRRRSATRTTDPGEDADDDGDASDVEDFVDNDDISEDGSGEFEADENEVDDETTLIQEEKMPQEMNAQDELALLQRENELSVEELRAMYAKMNDQHEDMEVDDEGSEERVGVSEEASLQALTKDQAPDDDNDDDVEFNPDNPNEVDDETTIEAEEKLGRDMSHAQEMEMLKNESEIPIEQLRAMYASMNNDGVDDDGDSLDELMEEVEDGESDSEGQAPSAANLLATGEDDTDDYRPDAAEGVDDETTIEAEERLGRTMSYKDEITMLNRENEMSVEELRAMYAGMSNDNDDDNTSDAMEESENDDSSGDGNEAPKESVADMLANATDADGGDYTPDAGEGIDDETTLEAEEKLGRDMSYKQELDLLQKESEMSVEELRAMYAPAYSPSNDDGQASEEDDQKKSSLASMLSSTGEDDVEDYRPDAGEGVDDETTMAEEERMGRDMSYEQEISLLQKESEVSVEELRARYLKMAQEATSEEENEVDEDLESSQKRRRVHDVESSSKKAKIDAESDTGDDGRAALDALEASAEKARQTLATRPFLLKSWVKLREYQQIGLNWLVSLQSRRLNGILADGRCTSTYRPTHFVSPCYHHSLSLC